MQIPDSDGRHPLGEMLDERIAQGGEIARLHMNAPRYWIALAAWVALGGVLLWFALTSGTLVSTLIGAIGLVLIYAAIRTALAGRHELILTMDTLSDTRGRVVAQVDDVASVDRSMFAVRPSNGFSIRLKSKAPRAWQPGLWWRIGSRIGVGGLTPAGQGRAMADLLSAMVQDRRNNQNGGD